MKQMKKAMVVAAMVAMFGGSAFAGLTWTSSNVPDANTIALYHFDETAGVLADNAEGTAAYDITLSNAAMISGGAPSWLAAPSGRYLANGGVGGDGQSNNKIPTNWATISGMTVSYWMRTNDQTSLDNYPAKFSDGGGWKNEQFFKYHPGWSDRYNARAHNVDSGKFFFTGNINVHDGQWHHIAVTYDASDGKGRFYIDNVLQQVGPGPDFDWDASSPSNLSASARVYVSQITYWGDVDELLIQAEALTDFSNGINAPLPERPIAEPAATLLIGLGGLGALRRRRS